MRPPAALDVPASRTAGHGPLALAGAASSLAPGPSPFGCAARHWPVAAARRPGGVSANTALVCCDCFIDRLPRWEEPSAQAASAPAVAGRRLITGPYRTKLFHEMCVYSHKRQIHFQQLSCIRNNFGDQPARPAPTSAPPRPPGPGWARAAIGTARHDKHGAAPRCRRDAALPGNGCALRGRLRRSQGTATALSGDGCAPGDGCGALRGRLRRSQGTTALPGDGCSSRQVDKDCVFEPTGPVDVHAPKVPLLMHVSWSDMTRVHPELNGYEPDAHSASPAPSA